MNPHLSDSSTQALTLPRRLSAETKGPVPPTGVFCFRMVLGRGVLVCGDPAHAHESSDETSSAHPPSSLQWTRPSTWLLSGQSQWEQDVLVLLPWTGPMSYFGARLLMGHEYLLDS